MVLAWLSRGCGSVPEIVEEGLTGFIVQDEDDAAAAVSRLDRLDRRAIRRRFEERFSATAMARRYLDLYAGLGAARAAPGVALAANQLDFSDTPTSGRAIRSDGFFAHGANFGLQATW